jgi:hypothetical protein
MKNFDEIINDFEGWIVLNLAGDDITRTLDQLSEFLLKINSSYMAKKLYELIIKYINKLKEMARKFIESSSNYFKYLLS